MNLSNELISQFVKATKDTKKTSTESTVYGTTVEYNGKIYVKLDGSDLLTPVNKTTDVKNDERVTVMIKDHTATVTGNISSPAARTHDVQEIGNQITEVEILVADKVSTKELEAESGRIDTLISENVTIKEKLTASEAKIDKLMAEDVTINGKLTAQEASIKKLDAEKLSTNAADIKFATIESLDAIEIDVHNLEGTYGEFQKLTAQNFDAINAAIDNLDATYATIEQLEAEQARINVLEATYLTADSAEIKNLQADVADIDTLIFGSATGTTIQTSFANAVIAQLGNAQIKSAMIESVSANKIDAGVINTNNVNIASDDGRLVISDETIQISDATRVRVQIGKDASGDYSISIWDADGKLMFSEGGITDNAIKDAIIRNDMISENANISASKLDISSLFTVINESTQTINATKIHLDDEKQTLDVAFTSMSSDLDDLDNVVSSQGTSISVMQGQIDSKIWQQDINTAIDEVDSEINTLTTKQSSIEQTVNGLSATVSQHTSQIANKADSSTVTTVSDKVNKLESNLDGFKSTISETYATKNDVSIVETAANEAKSKADQAAIAAADAEQSADEAKSKATQAQTDLTTAQQNLANVSSRVDATEDEIAEAQAAIVTAQAAADKAQNEAEAAQATANTAKTNAATAQTAANNAQAAADAAQADVDDLAINVSKAETQIAQNTTQISLMATKEELAQTLDDYYTITETEAAIKLESDSITQSVSNTYATKSALETASQFSLRTYTVDLTADTYDQNTFYPVVSEVSIPNPGGYRAHSVIVHLNTNSKPSWATHDVGFTCDLQVKMKPFGWGTVTYDMGWIEDNSYLWCDQMPAYIQQMTNSSRAVFYLRGGGRYFVFIDYDTTLAIKTEAYTYNDQTVSPIALPSVPTNWDHLADSWVDRSRIATAETKITQNSQAIELRATKTEVQNIAVGGRNLLCDSTVISAYGSANGITTGTSADGYFQIVADTVNENWVSLAIGSNYAHVESELAEGDVFTISFTMRSTDSILKPTVYIKSGLGYYELTGTMSSKWSSFWYTGTWKDANDIQFHMGFSGRGGTYEIKNCQIEKGNKATAWTPAPEDVDKNIADVQTEVDEAVNTTNERITKSESLIQQISNCISMLVTDANGESLMTQTENGWTFSMKETSEAVSSLSSTLETLQNQTGGTQATVNALQQAVNDHGATLEYVNVSIYEAEPCIELGESDSDFKLLITNTRIMFRHGSNIPTLINTNGLVTQNIEVKGELIQGGYVQLNTADGGWGLLWKGVSS